MAFKLEPGVEYITHDDPEHDHIRSLCDYNSCRPCDCAEVKEIGEHCQHCYYCWACSSAVAMGCRQCPSSPNTSIYRSFIVRRRKDGFIDWSHDCKKTKEGNNGAEEWCLCMEVPQSPDIYPNSPLPSDNEDVAVDQAESEKTLQGTSPKL